MAERVYTLGDLDGAIRWQEAAFTALPQRPEIVLNLAQYLGERARPGDLERADGLLDTLVHSAPAEPQLLDALGTFLANRGKLLAARSAWLRALQIDPGYTPAREHLGALHGPDGSTTPPGTR